MTADAFCATSRPTSSRSATGPTGNRYGDAAGHSCLAVAGPGERVVTLETGKADRVLNMRLFSAEALRILIEQLSQ